MSRIRAQLRPRSEHGHNGPYRFTVCGGILLACNRQADSIPGRRTTMRKLWVKAWMTLDGVVDSDTMEQYWWHSTNSPERMQYITEEYAQGDAYLLGRVTYEMLWPGWSTQTTGDG